MMREVTELPLVLLLALQSDCCHRIPMNDGEVVRVGEWVVLRELGDEDEDGERLVISTRAFLFESEDEAGQTLDVLVAEGERP